MIATPQPLAKYSRSRGFSLALTLLLLAAITIIVVGLLGSMISDHSASVSHEAVDRVDLALDAAFTHATTLLIEQTRNDHYLILQQHFPNPAHPQYPKALLIAANPNADFTSWTYTPLASGLKPAREVAGSPKLQGVQFDPIDSDAASASRELAFTPWKHQPDQVYWVTCHDSLNDHPDDPRDTTHTISRYAFWIEDLQGLINLQTAGNANRNQQHHRTDITDPEAPAFVPGINLTHDRQPFLNQTALYTLFNPHASQDDENIRLDNWLIDHRSLLVSPGSWKAIVLKQGLPPSWLIRDRTTKLFPEGTYYDEDSHHYLNAINALDYHTTTGVLGYEERALIPPYPPQHGFMGQGEPKLNLNRVLQQLKNQTLTSEQAVEQIAQHIRNHLPEFEQRAGGFPFPEGGSDGQKRLGYLKALAASIIDYADEDSVPTVKDGEYRGIDAIPLVNEYFVKARLVHLAKDESEVTWSLSFYAEIWNLTNHPIAGELQASFEFLNEVSIYADTYQPSTEDGLSRMLDPKPTLENGIYWFAPVLLSEPIQPNQHRVVQLGEVTFKHPITPIGDEDFQILIAESVSDRYRIRYKGPDSNSPTLILTDRPRGTLHRQDAVLKNSKDNSDKIKISSNGAAAQYGYTLSANSWIAEKGDPRASFYLGEPRDITNPNSRNFEFQGAVAYAEGATPGGRNMRKNVKADPVRAYAETLVRLWPDGGHDIEPGNTPPSSLSDPDNLSKYPIKDPGSPPKSPQRISNAGRYFSVTELGNIFDPHMWKPEGYEGLRNQLRLFHDLQPGSQAQPSPLYCGGNTLRIGRVEHTRWRPDYRSTPAAHRPRHRGLSASALLDIFHTGMPVSNDTDKIGGDLVHIHPGQINLNTATRETLRAILAGSMMAAPHSKPSPIHPPFTEHQADEIAQAIIHCRPYLSPAEAADKVRTDHQDSDEPLFGNARHYRDANGEPLGPDHEINDAALEELFARLYNNSTVRSRNFRIHMVAQTLRHTRSGELRMEATRSRICHVFIQPVRDTNGLITRQNVHVSYVQTP